MDYYNELEKLRLGEIDSLVITPEVFSEFYVVWTKYQHQNLIYGEAHRGGKIIYKLK